MDERSRSGRLTLVPPRRTKYDATATIEATRTGIDQRRERTAGGGALRVFLATKGA
jgi:hypothetical protein